MSGSAAGRCAPAVGEPRPERRVRPRAHGPIGAQPAAAGAGLSSLLQRAAAIAGAGAGTQEVCNRLRLEGAEGADDFVGISVDEAVIIWAPLVNLGPAVVSAFLELCENSVRPGRARGASSAAAASSAPRSQGAVRLQGGDAPEQARPPAPGCVGSSGCAASVLRGARFWEGAAARNSG